MTSPEFSSLDEFARSPIDGADERALGAIAQLYGTLDPVPAGLIERIQFGITLDALHAEIAELQRSGDLVGVRSDDVTEAQTITFNSSSLTLMITVSPASADRVRVDGWVAPGAGAVIELRSGGSVNRETADDDGRFVFDNISRGLAQLVVRPASPAGQPPVITPSIEL